MGTGKGRYRGQCCRNRGIVFFFFVAVPPGEKRRWKMVHPRAHGNLGTRGFFFWVLQQTLPGLRFFCFERPFPHNAKGRRGVCHKW